MPLSIDYNTLRREIGRFLNLGRDPDNDWSSQQASDVADIIRSGLRRVYWPPLLPAPEGRPQQPQHAWSFLRPVSTLDVKAGVSTYTLPEDFSGMLSGATFAGGSADVVPEEQIRSLAARSGTPIYCAVRPRPITDGSIETAYEILLYPTPSADLTASFRYTRNPPEISADNPYPLGGPKLSELILESCLAAAEKTLEDTEGIHAKRFMECLVAAISQDKATLATEENDIWPLDNPATGLEVNRAYLRRLAGRELGYGPNPGIWSHKETQEVELAVQTGQRKFYAPLPLPGEKAGHEWSFLRPLLPIRLVAGQYQYDLPQDFAGMLGPIVFEPESDVLYPPLRLVGEWQLRQKLQLDYSSTRPTLAAIATKPPDLIGGGYVLLVWPSPDDTYILNVRYQSNPEAVADETQLPHGGQAHAQTIIEAVLAACEEQIGKLGVHSKLFLERMLTSVGHDRKLITPDTLGMNIDRSDGPETSDRNWHRCTDGLIAYNGVYY